MYLIVSGTGRIGGAVARALLADGARVRVAARNPGRMAELQDLGAEVARFDLTDADTFKPALQGIDHVLATAHGMIGTGANSSQRVDLDGYHAFIDAAKWARVGRFVYISALGASSDHPIDFFRHKFATEEYLRASGLGHTILRPAAFMEIWGELIGRSVLTQGKTTLFGPGTNPISFISERDVVAFALLALQDTALRNKTIDLGAENLTHTQVAELYASALGKTVRINHVPLPVLRFMALLIAPFNEGQARLIRTAIHMATAEMRFDPTRLLQTYPRTLVSFHDVVREAILTLGVVQAA
ncbi:MAG: NmrA family NAD(P)-binding protein [Oscillochloris sp.]|nr:NmrA family NAD(P)-binding protein [Oscillochloris sp.]